jgi:hypothetical protein
MLRHRVGQAHVHGWLGRLTVASPIIVDLIGAVDRPVRAGERRAEALQVGFRREPTAEKEQLGGGVPHSHHRATFPIIECYKRFQRCVYQRPAATQPLSRRSCSNGGNNRVTVGCVIANKACGSKPARLSIVHEASGIHSLYRPPRIAITFDAY